MILPESFVFSEVAPIIQQKYNAFVSGEYVEVPAKFPAVTIMEMSNTVNTRMRTLSIENAVNVMYEVNIYTNGVYDKKEQANEILEDVDEIFTRLGFTRTMCYPISNLQDATIYRIFVRYEGVVDKDLWVYTR